MKPDPSAGRLAEIERACARIRRHLSGLDRAGFIGNEQAQDAVLMQLIVIGEAANALDKSVLAEAPEITWPSLIALRNRIAHGYDSIDRPQVWDLCEQNLTALSSAIQRMLAARGEA